MSFLAGAGLFFYRLAEAASFWLDECISRLMRRAEADQGAPSRWMAHGRMRPLRDSKCPPSIRPSISVAEPALPETAGAPA
ncbi:hypothetical protein [Paenibacillus solanacearum]|uniref:hypothetical protein n=1 Tax=Paenibacillus solanacearum TaxID=2048548 RepID=UPI001C4044C0|nr:hypothetical protein [Paenibacillus solanacearum]